MIIFLDRKDDDDLYQIAYAPVDKQGNIYVDQVRGTEEKVLREVFKQPKLWAQARREEGISVKRIYLKEAGKDPVCSTCNKESGKQRFDRGLPCGVHCDKCFQELQYDCRKRSW